ncbi:MAG: hypothetical protein WCJ37_11945 [Syntrophus sp. (in: bacteria)]
MRHANAVDGADDFSRPLTKRGQRQAEQIGIFMAERFVIPDLIISPKVLPKRGLIKIFSTLAGILSRLTKKDYMAYIIDLFAPYALIPP